MPLYEFTDVSSGARVERYFPMAGAPSIGTEIREGRRRLRRIPSDALMNGNPVSQRFPAVMRMVPRRTPWRRHDHRGFPVVNNAREMRDFMSKYNLVRDE